MEEMYNNQQSGAIIEWPILPYDYATKHDMCNNTIGGMFPIRIPAPSETHGQSQFKKKPLWQSCCYASNAHQLEAAETMTS